LVANEDVRFCVRRSAKAAAGIGRIRVFDWGIFDCGGFCREMEAYERCVAILKCLGFMFRGGISIEVCILLRLVRGYLFNYLAIALLLVF